MVLSVVLWDNRNTCITSATAPASGTLCMVTDITQFTKLLCIPGREDRSKASAILQNEAQSTQESYRDEELLIEDSGVEYRLSCSHTAFSHSVNGPAE